MGVFRRDLGLLPVVGALVAIGLGFQWMSPEYLTARNMSNLAVQVVTLGILTAGVVMVLSIAEIDLSVGVVGGLAASVMGVSSTLWGLPAWIAIGLALGVGLMIGLLHGTVIVLVRTPSFIITLAGLLVWQGFQYLILSGQNGQIRIADPSITAIASTYLTNQQGWALGIGAALLASAMVLGQRLLSTRAGYGARPWHRDALAVAAIVAVAVGATAVLNAAFGVPLLVVVMLIVLGILTVVTRRTVFGRHMYAVGGNSQAARRTGVRVGQLVVVVFVLASTLAALSGVLDAARTYSVSTNTGGGNTALNAIAAAVIGGTSLFGGRGTVIGGLLGALVIAGVQNGLALIGQPAAVQLIATGAILALAVSIDVLSRRNYVKQK
jgi:D-xylose transport system permease protein